MHPLTILAIGAGAVTVAAAASSKTISAQRGPRGAALKLPPDRMPKPEPGLKVWGDSLEDNATWRPTYMKSRGLKWIKWGVCFDRWAADLDKHGVSSSQFQETVIKVAKAIDEDAGNIAEWLIEHACLRFQFRTHGYQDLNGNNAYEVDEKNGQSLDAAAPPIPLPPKSGFKRVWVSYIQDTKTRSPEAVMVFWPSSEAGGPIIREVIPRVVMRGLMRMDPAYPGALTVREMRNFVGKKRFKWGIPSRRRALSEYK